LEDLGEEDEYYAKAPKNTRKVKAPGDGVYSDDEEDYYTDGFKR